MRETTARGHVSTGEDGLVFDSGTPAFARRLTPRQKAQRGASALLAIAVTAFLLLGGPSGAVTLLHTLVARAGPSAPMLRLPALRRVPLPSGVTALSALHLSPAGGGSADVYACWTEPDPVAGPEPTAAGRVHLAVLFRSSTVWMDLAPPLVHARQCLITADVSVAPALLLSLFGVTPGGVDPGGDCAAPALFYSPDAGHSWVSVPWPQAHLVACTVRASLIEGRVYVHADNPLLPTNWIPLGAHARIIRSDDLGATWHAADTGLPDVDAFGIVGLRPRGRLLAETFDNRNPGNATLWESLSAGAFWTSLGRLPGAFPQVYVAADPSQVANGGWGKLYLTAHMSGASSGSGPSGASSAGAPLVATGWPDIGWTMLPAAPSPVLPATDDRLVVLGAVGPSDTLLLLRDVAAGSGSAFAPPLDIWLWNPVWASWREAGFQLPAGALAQGASWSGGMLRLWLLTPDPGAGTGTPTTPQLIALDVPPASVA